jgi:hypothetical protein
MRSTIEKILIPDSSCKYSISRILNTHYIFKTELWFYFVGDDLKINLPLKSGNCGAAVTVIQAAHGNLNKRFSNARK